MSLLSRFSRRGANGFGYGSTAEEVTGDPLLAGRTVLITGCNSGLGFETMRVLSSRGARVLGAARTLEKAQQACRSVGAATVPIACELSDPVSVRQCVARVCADASLSLDAVVCNAGIMALPRLTQAFGYELQFFTNHIGHFMLVTGLLLDRLAPEGRVVILSSAAHKMAPRGGIQFENLSGERGYRPWAAYGQSKFANLLFAKALAKRFAGTARTANAVHPGVIQTNLGRNMTLSAPVRAAFYGIGGALFLKGIPEGAATQSFVAVHPRAAAMSGLYWADCNPRRPRADALDPALAQQLWQVSEEIVARLPG